MSSILGDKVTVPLSSLLLHPENPREGDVEMISESLDELDQFMPLIIQTSTNYILAGNHTYKAATALGWEDIDVIYVDVDDSKAMRILLAANKTADAGGYNELLLLAILGDMREENEELLIGTGYTTDDVDELLANALAYAPEFEEEEDNERLNFAAAMLDRMMPPDANQEVKAAADAVEELLSENEKKPKARRPAFSPPTEFVIFRFGEIQAKVSRPAYEEFLKRWVKEHGGDLAKAGIAAAIHLGLPEDKVEAAVAEGTERWL